MPKSVIKPRTKVVCYNCGKQGNKRKEVQIKVKWLDGEVEEMDGGDWLNVGWLVKGKSSG